MKKNNGFTLIEVLIALVILAIALTAVILTIQNSVHAMTRIKDRLGAHWSAMNVLAGLQTGVTALPQSADDVIHGKMFGKTWYARVNTVSSTSSNGSIQVQIDVAPTEDGAPIEQLSGFIRPAAKSAASNV